MDQSSIKSRRISTLALGATFAALAACGSGEKAPEANAGGTGAGATGGTGGGGHHQTVKCEEPAALALGGTWAAKVKIGVTLQSEGGVISICPVDQKAEANLMMLFTLEQDPADPSKIKDVQARVCSLEMPTVTAKVGVCEAGDPNLVRTVLVLPPALNDALMKLPPPVEPVTGRIGGSAPGASFDIDRIVIRAGSKTNELPKWDMKSEACRDPAPAKLGKTRTCVKECVDRCDDLPDDDHDGYPGVTLEVCGRTPEQKEECVPAAPDESSAMVDGRAWIGLKVDPLLTGTATSSCEINGTLESEILYEIVGADVRLQGSGAIGVRDSRESLPSFKVQPSLSDFRFVRVDGQFGTANLAVDWSKPVESCADLMKRQNEVFP